MIDNPEPQPPPPKSVSVIELTQIRLALEQIKEPSEDILQAKADLDKHIRLITDSLQFQGPTQP